MSHFLIADDMAEVRRSFRLLLESEGHTYEEASDIREILKAVKKSESNEGEPFDLILLDYDFDNGTTGFHAIEALNKRIQQDYCEHRIVVITGYYDRELPSEFAMQGAIGHLLKPVNEPQFWATINAALTRRELYIEKRADWESAYAILQEHGILEGIEELNQYVAGYECLKQIYQQLLVDLQTAGEREQKIAKAYEKATESLNAAPGRVEAIYAHLKDFGYTQKFIDDVETIFKSDRLHFFLLESYLHKIRENPKAYRIKYLAPGAPGHYEYRVGRTFRLYFRKADGDQIIFERFGHKNVQDKIITYLGLGMDADISMAPQASMC